MIQVTKLPGFIERHGLWTDEQRRQAEELKRRVKKDNLKLVRLAWADPHGASRAKAVRRRRSSPRSTNGYNINRRDHDARFRRMPAPSPRSPRRRHRPRRDDRARPISPSFPIRRPSACCPGRPVSAGCCATNISTAACRSTSRRANCCAGSCGGSTSGLSAAWSAWRSSGTCCASLKSISTAENIGAPGDARPADQHVAGRARLFLSFRIQPGPDAAGAVARSPSLRDHRPAAALDRERVGSGPGRVHLCAARPALEAADNAAAVSHRDAADLPPHGLSRDLHGRPALKGYLLERLASASVAGRRQRAAETCSCRRRDGEPLSPLGRAFLGGLLQLCRAAHGVRDTDRQRLSPLPAELARARPRHLVLRPSRRDGARARRVRRSGDPAGEPDRRARRQSLSLYRVADRRRARRRRACSAIPARRTTSPTTPTGPCCRRACRTRSTRSSRSRCSVRSSATCSSTTSSSSSATRPAASRNG